MKSHIHFGIIGLGKIARKFADDLSLVPGAKLHAVASSSSQRAEAFAKDYNAPFAYGNYHDILNCPNLDVIYIATPHPMHANLAIQALGSGIAALVEKPFAMNLQEAQKVVATARNNKIFLMEALWTRFIPAFQKAISLIESGAIGPVNTVTADFGFKSNADPSSRLFNKALGGGALLDIGIYPALLALTVLGIPEANNIQASATFTHTEVDASCAFSFVYPPRSMAIGHASLDVNTPIEAYIYGESGSIVLHPRWHHPHGFTLKRLDHEPEIFQMPYPGWGYQFEAAHVVECLRSGKTESPVVPLDFTLGLTATLDAIREKIGLAY